MKRFLLALFLFAKAGLYAQETDDLMQMSLDDLLNMKVEVSSSKSVNIFKSPSTVSVIDKQMIKDYNFRTISEAISYLSDVNVGRGDLKNHIPTVRGILQDNYANKVLLLINGIPLWSALAGQSDIDRIGIDEVERIEVLKGPASVLYGTNAYSGAINIVLAKSEADHINMHGSVGELGGITAGGNVQTNSGGVNMLFSFNTSKEDGAKRLLGLEGGDSAYVNDYFNSSNFTANFNYQNHNLFVNAFSNDELSMGTTIALASGAGTPARTKGYAVSYGYGNELFNGFELNYRITYDWSGRNIVRGYSKLSKGDSISDDGAGYRVLNELNAYYNINSNLSWEILADYDYLKNDFYRTLSTRTGDIITEANMNGQDNNEFSLGTQINYDPFEQLTINLGTRYTNNKLAGDNVSSRATAVFLINEKNSLKFIFGQSFRAPTLFEQYFVADKIIYGNSKLKPETSNSFELMYITSFDNFLVQLTGFYSTYDNKIFRGLGTPIEGDTSQHYNMYLNGNPFLAKGVELEIKYNNNRLINGFLSYSYIDGDNGDNYNGSYNYLYVPQHQASFGLSKSFDRLTISALGLVYSEMNGPKAVIDMQYVLNFNIQYTQKLSLFSLRHVLSVKNFMNKDTFYPEFSRRIINDIPWMAPRVISYTIFADL